MSLVQDNAGNFQTIYAIESAAYGGAYNMALDEALLEWVRTYPVPVLIVRTYEWDVPTLSLGVNQAIRDLNYLLAFYQAQTPEGVTLNALVRRPTGGRAILHGQDISYAFVTNEPAILRQRLKTSYEIFAGLVQQALQRLELPVSFSGQATGKEYVRSPVCFETHTPSDLLAENGEKLTGSAQLRRSGGLLQHGAAFLNPYGIAATRFTDVLLQTVSQQYGNILEPFPLSLVAPLMQSLLPVYEKTSGEILANASTTSGSHLLPASF